MAPFRPLLPRICVCAFFALLAAGPAAALDGAWDGKLDMGLFGDTRISVAAKDNEAVIASPDQEWRDVKTTVTEAGGRTTLTAASIGATFRGAVSRDGKTLVGRWTQNGRVRPLLLQRRTGATPAWPALAQPPARRLSDAEITAILRKRIQTDRQGMGIVVGIIDKQGRRIIAFGRSGTSRPLDGKTLFEIGSISKPFTSLLLQDAVARGEVALNDPAARLAPPGLVIPKRGNRPVTLADLATHTSGLPDDDAAFWGKNPDRVSPNYDTARLFRFISQSKLSHDPGTVFNYSNVGASLLGQLLAHKAGKPYGQLVRERITLPLGMKDTNVAPPAGVPLAIGHNAALKPLPPFAAQAYDPAGGLRSSMDDMLTFLGAELGYVKTPLAPTMRAQWTGVRRPSINRHLQAALGWAVALRPAGEIIWHNGGTLGFRTFAGFNPKTGTGVVVLTNATSRLASDDIGLHLLDPSAPLDELAPASN